jgi:hypothetical protein
MAFGKSDNNEFFNSWELWQKMTFVLACGIVVTIFLGFLKLWYDRTKLRKYSKVNKGKQAQTPEMLESQPVTQVMSETKDEIPFGVRAIESGIEVDGVWISRSNTPVGSSRSSIMMETKLPRSFNNSQLELPQTAYASSRGSSQAFDRAVSAERIQTNDSRSSSPQQPYAADGRGRPAAGSSRYSTSNAPRNYAPPSHSGPPSPPNGNYGDYDPSSKTSRRTSDESDYMAIGQDVRAYETAYMRPASGLSPIDPRTDLDLLQSHRMSHVAETGQLTPRNGVSYFLPQKTPSPPYPAVEQAEQQTPNYAGSNQSSSQTNQGVPLAESYAPNAPYYPDTYQVRGPQHQMSYDEVPYEVQTMQNKDRDTEVLRSVNSGFQVLKPGTFAAPAPEEMELAERRQSTGKKLQKKRRSSDDSRKSAFTEQV